MSVGVVDLLEIVNVYHDTSKIAGAALGHYFHLIIKVGSVVKSGQSIHIGELVLGRHIDGGNSNRQGYPDK